MGKSEYSIKRKIRIMENDKSEFSEIVAKMFQFAGTAVVASKMLIERPDDSGHDS